MHETRAGSTDTAEPRDDDRWAPHVVWWFVGAAVVSLLGYLLFGRYLPLLFLGAFLLSPMLMMAYWGPRHRSPVWVRSHGAAAWTVGSGVLIAVGLSIATGPFSPLAELVIGVTIAVVGITGLIALAVRERRADVRREIARYEAEQRREIEHRNDAEQRPLAEDDRPM